jgi:hypothetical protein
MPAHKSLKSDESRLLRCIYVVGGRPRDSRAELYGVPLGVAPDHLGESVWKGVRRKSCD